MSDGCGDGNGVGRKVGWHVVQDNVTSVLTPPTADPPEYSYHVAVISGGVFNQSSLISSKIKSFPSPSIAQLTLEE